MAENLGDAPNPAGFYFEALIGQGEATIKLVTDKSWQWSATLPKDNGKFEQEPTDWQAAVPLANQKPGSVSKATSRARWLGPSIYPIAWFALLC